MSKTCAIGLENAGVKQARGLYNTSCGLVLAITLVACGGVPKVDIQADGEPVTSESGNHFEISVRLAKRPQGAVTVYAVSSDESEGTVSQPLVFNGRDWDAPQTLTVTGVGDDLEDGDVAYEVTIYVQTAWRHDEPSLLDTIELVNRDDDVARFDRLGDLSGGEQASYVTDLSEAGDVVVGWSMDANGERAVRWTEQSGLRGLGGPSSRAQAVRADGGLVGGSIVQESYEGGRAAVIWRHELAYEVLEGPRQPPDGPITLQVVDAKVVLAENLVYGTCLQYGAYGEPLACRYDGPGSVTILGGPGHVFAADDQENYAGTLHSERHAPFYSFATYNGTQLPYPDGVQCSPNLGCTAEARDFAAGVIVGTSHVPDPGTSPLDTPPLSDNAFTYTEARGALRLPDLQGGATSSGAYAIDGDARVIAGFGSDEAGQHAVIWIERMPLLLADVFLDAGGELPSGFELSDIRAVSADGRTFAGNGTNADGGAEGFRITLPTAP
jgi:hypothetical protein